MNSAGAIDLSVIIPCFNGAQTLRAAVESISRDLRCEIIIVDDGSTDDSSAIARQLALADPGRVLVVGQANTGLSGARNTGIRLAAGKYFYFLDADDEIAEGFAEVAMRRLESDAELVGVQGHVELVNSHREIEPWQLKIMEGTMMGTVLLRASIVRQIGGFPVDPAFNGAVGGEDGVFRHELARFGTVLELPVKAVRYRMRRGNHVDLFLDRARLENGNLVFTTKLPEELDGTLSQAIGRYRRRVARQMLATKLEEIRHQASAVTPFTIPLMQIRGIEASDFGLCYFLYELARTWPAQGAVVALLLDGELLRWLDAGCVASGRGSALADVPASPTIIRLLIIGRDIDKLPTRLASMSRDGLVVVRNEEAHSQQLDTNVWISSGQIGSYIIWQHR